MFKGGEVRMSFFLLFLFFGCFFLEMEQKWMVDIFCRPGRCRDDESSSRRKSIIRKGFQIRNLTTNESF